MYAIDWICPSHSSLQACLQITKGRKLIVDNKMASKSTANIFKETFCVCECEYMSVCLCVHVCECVYICVCECMYVCLCLWLCVRLLLSPSPSPPGVQLWNPSGFSVWLMPCGVSSYLLLNSYHPESQNIQNEKHMVHWQKGQKPLGRRESDLPHHFLCPDSKGS